MKTERMEARSGGLEKFLIFFKENNVLGLNFHKTIFEDLKFNIIAILIILSNAISVYADGGKQVYKFQFAPDNASAFSDFVKVSKDKTYTPAIGYGWKDSTTLREKLQKEPRGDILACSYIANIFGKDMEFILDLPNGKYEVVFWMGDFQGSYAYPSRPFTVFADGESVYNEKIDAATFYNKYFCQMYGVDWTMKDTSLWDKYVSPRFPRRSFITEVKKGQLSLRWHAIGLSHRTDAYLADCRVNGLMIYPVELKSDAEHELQQCDKIRRRGFNSFWHEGKKEPAPTNPLTLSAEEKKNGYILFTRHYMDYVYPSTFPSEEERLKGLNTFAAQGEYEPMTFSVHPTVDLQDVKVTVSDLKNKNGDVINSSAITVEWIIHNVWPNSKTGEYTIMPEYSMRKDTVSLVAGTTKQCWMTLKVPDDAKGGLYHGALTFAPANYPIQQIPVTIRVLPFKLMPLTDHSISYQWFPFLWHVVQCYPLPSDEYWKWIEKQMVDQREMGCTSMDWITSWKFDDIKVENGQASGKWKTGGYTYDDTEKYFDLCSKVMPPNSSILIVVNRTFGTEYRGEGQPFYDIGTYRFPSDEWKTAAHYILESFSQMAKKHSLSPIFYTTAETNNGGLIAIRAVEDMMRFLKTMPEYTYATFQIGPEGVKMLSPLFNIVGMNWAGPLNEENIGYVKSLKKQLFLYQACNRFEYGFYYWKVGAQGDTTEFYNHLWGDQFNNFTGGDVGPSVSSVKIGPNGEPIHMLKYYFCREGIDDLKYLNTLENLIIKGKTSKDDKIRQAAENARKVMDEIMAGININYAWYMDAGNCWKSSQYDVNRWKIAEQILSLLEVMK